MLFELETMKIFQEVLMNHKSLRKMLQASLMLALGLILPFLTAQIPDLGNKFLPMHLPVLLTGFICGWPYGLVVGFIVPLFRSLLFSMPPMFPIALAMAFELAAYGAATGLLYKILPKKNISIYIALLASMIFGRIIWGSVSILFYQLNGSAFTWKMFTAGALLNAIPGILIQIALIPLLVIALRKTNLIENA
jgi:thiamine transporter ThiT